MCLTSAGILEHRFCEAKNTISFTEAVDLLGLITVVGDRLRDYNLLLPRSDL